MTTDGDPDPKEGRLSPIRVTDSRTFNPSFGAGDASSEKDSGKYVLNRSDWVYIEDEIRNHVSKLFELGDGTRNGLPAVDRCFSCPQWKVDALREQKEALNAVKSKLNHFNLDKWHSHTRYTNYGGAIIPAVRNLRTELLTQAWCKFYEILENFVELLPRAAVNSGALNSIHLCEAPGAFITALNHNLTLNYPEIKWQWRAATLNPYYEGNPLQKMINDDRFLMKTLDKWLFGDDYTGNIYEEKNLESLRREVLKIGPIHLVTADGSFDCTSDPAEQETNVLPLLYSEAITALRILAPGGSFVLKIFTIFECPTICLMFLLRSTFKQVAIYKPVASKEGNSEVYVICQEFLGRTSCKSILRELIKKMDAAPAGPALFTMEDIGEEFLKEIQQCAIFFTDVQMSVIERNIRLFMNMTQRDQLVISRIRRKIADHYVRTFRIKSLPENSQLLGKQTYYRLGHHLSPKGETGTFAEMQQLKDNNSQGVVAFNKSKLELMHYQWPSDHDVIYLDSKSLFPTDTFIEPELRLGKPFKTILSSRFCPGDLLTIFNEIHLNTVPVVSYDFWCAPLNSLVFNRMIAQTYSAKVTLDVRGLPWLDDYHAALAKCLKMLEDIFYKLETSINLIVLGLPLLTQFNVGLVFFLARHFCRIGFANPSDLGYCVIFEDLRSPQFCALKHILMCIEEEMCLAPISLTNINSFGDDYIRIITDVNQISLRKCAWILVENY
ncbi:FtsJ-like methyltransferase [Nesidiocoris tenuis]|uniref:Cap-specific mRNA (nucleoside-2'-O-)-methyltransferase 2 n=1 Tax=Nesidiocoris tenuis TaxID=355587 RepID=A0ABN7ANG7_9HEMI|nr:FtsJ-like methyltransferase [Nesidiocoris tenuis]